MFRQPRVLLAGGGAVLLIVSLFVPGLVQAQPDAGTRSEVQAPAQNAPAAAANLSTRQQAFLRFMEARRLRSEQVIKAYRDTLWLDPQAAEPRVDLGELYFFFKNDFRSAEREALEAIKHDDKCVGAHLLLARLSIAVLKMENQREQQVTAQLDRALREFEMVTKLDGSNAEAWAFLAELYRMRNETAKQVQALERWASAPLPSDQQFFFWFTNSNLTPDQAFAQLSQIYLSQGRRREALDAARRAYEFDPENNEFARNLIRTLRAATTIKEELKLYARLTKTAPSPALEIGYGSALIRAGRYAEAVEKLQESAQSETANNSLISLLATAQRRAGQRAAAAETLKSALARAEAKSRTSLILELAETYEELGRIDDALAQYEQILDTLTAKGTVSEQTEGLFNHVTSKAARLCRRTGNQIKLQTLLARARRAIREQNPLIETLTVEGLREVGKRREALDLTHAAIRRAPEDRSLKLTEVLILSELKKYQEGAELLRGMLSGAVERAAEDASIYLILSNVQLQAGELKEAEAAVRKALELNPGDSDALLQLSSVLDRATHHAEAERILRELLDREPDNATALNNLAYFWAERGVHLTEARELIERAVAIEPLNGSFLDSYGWVLFKLNQLEPAREQLEKALLYTRRNPTLHEHLGDVLHKLGKLVEARRAWEKALEYSLEADETARLKVKLKDLR
jgi:tetratricopeptide (TPR) repeat protein